MAVQLRHLLPRLGEAEGHDDAAGSDDERAGVRVAQDVHRQRVERAADGAPHVEGLHADADAPVFAGSGLAEHVRHRADARDG